MEIKTIQAKLEERAKSRLAADIQRAISGVRSIGGDHLTTGLRHGTQAPASVGACLAEVASALLVGKLALYVSDEVRGFLDAHDRIQAELAELRRQLEG